MARSRKKSRYSEHQQGLRGLQVREFARNYYLAAKGLSVGTHKLVNDLLNHLAAFHGPTLVKDLSDDLLYQFRDYFLGRIADGQMGPSNANKNLRQLKAIGNQAFRQRLLKGRLYFNDFMKEPTPKPTAFTLDESWRIGQAARQMKGFVGDRGRHGYEIPAGVWWLAWYYVISRIGNRLTAMMLAERGDYTFNGKEGVLWLKAENQKQGEDQRLALPDYAHPAIQDLLDAHDTSLLFPWPFDATKPGERHTWKILFKHFRQRILAPAGVVTKKGALTRVFRQTVATRIDCLGGDATEQLGHSNRAITDKFYKDKSQARVITGALLIGDDRPPEQQLNLFGPPAVNATTKKGRKAG